MKKFKIGELVLKKNNPSIGRVLDTRYYEPRVLVGWKVKFKGKLLLSAKWVKSDLLTIHIPETKLQWLKRNLSNLIPSFSLSHLLSSGR